MCDIGTIARQTFELEWKKTFENVWRSIVLELKKQNRYNNKS